MTCVSTFMAIQLAHNIKRRRYNKKIFIFNCIFLISEISKEILTMKKEPFLLICDGHPSRYCFVACYFLYLFCHLIQLILSNLLMYE